MKYKFRIENLINDTQKLNGRFMEVRTDLKYCQ